MKYRVVRISNFDHDDWRGDQWFASMPLYQKQAEAVAEALNKLQNHDYDDDYFVVKEETYNLPPKWEP